MPGVNAWMALQNTQGQFDELPALCLFICLSVMVIIIIAIELKDYFKNRSIKKHWK